MIFYTERGGDICIYIYNMRAKWIFLKEELDSSS